MSVSGPESLMLRSSYVRSSEVGDAAEDLGSLLGDRRSDAVTLAERRPDSVPGDG